jgi:hypothetical protein
MTAIGGPHFKGLHERIVGMQWHPEHCPQTETSVACGDIRIVARGDGGVPTPPRSSPPPASDGAAELVLAHDEVQLGRAYPQRLRHALASSGAGSRERSGNARGRFLGAASE